MRRSRFPFFCLNKDDLIYLLRIITKNRFIWENSKWDRVTVFQPTKLENFFAFSFFQLRNNTCMQNHIKCSLLLFWPLYLKEKVQALRVHADFPPACSHMPAGEALARTASAARVQRLIKKDLLTSKIFLRRVIRWIASISWRISVSLN